MILAHWQYFVTILVIPSWLCKARDDSGVCVTGQVCRFCPKSSKQWEDDAMDGGVSTKELVLRLIQHECKEVSLHALRCAQKMMCVNWELAAATTNKII